MDFYCGFLSSEGVKGGLSCRSIAYGGINWLQNSVEWRFVLIAWLLAE